MRNLLVISKLPETKDVPDHMSSLTCGFFTQWLEDELQQQQLNARRELTTLQVWALNSCSKTNLALGSLVGELRIRRQVGTGCPFGFAPQRVLNYVGFRHSLERHPKRTQNAPKHRKGELTNCPGRCPAAAHLGQE